MNRQSRCAQCRRRFVPNPRSKTQRFCSHTPCQRARKATWQRNKMATDPDYQANQRDARQAWQNRHRISWRQYRQRHPAYCERNRLLQQHRDHSRRRKPLAKMDALSMKCHLVPMT